MPWTVMGGRALVTPSFLLPHLTPSWSLLPGGQGGQTRPSFRGVAP